MKALTLILVIAVLAVTLFLPAHAEGLTLHPQTAVATQTSSSSDSSLTLPGIIMLLMGSGGIGYFLDRRGKKAVDTSQLALNATETFKLALDEERNRVTELEKLLNDARAELAKALQVNEEHKLEIVRLQAKVTALEVELATAKAKVETYERTVLPAQIAKPDC